MRHCMKRMAVLVTVALTLALGMLLSSCTTDNDFEEQEMVPGDMPGGGSGSDDGDTPDFDSTITAWNGQTADDAALDVVGTDETSIGKQTVSVLITVA